MNPYALVCIGVGIILCVVGALAWWNAFRRPPRMDAYVWVGEGSHPFE